MLQECLEVVWKVSGWCLNDQNVSKMFIGDDQMIFRCICIFREGVKNTQREGVSQYQSSSFSVSLSISVSMSKCQSLSISLSVSVSQSQTERLRLKD